MPAVDPVIIELRLRADRLERDLRRVESRVGGAASRMTALLAGVSVAALAKEFLSLADTSKQLEAQLRLATQTFGTFSQAQADSQRIAAATRTSLEATTSLYGNLVRATQTLGGNQDQAARATETFSKALKLGGADANAAASATLQFGQALASGALRGDEFNSIAEASPRILRLIAEAVGVPQGALRKLAEEGKLTSDVLFKALTDRRFTDGIDSEFKTLPVTFDESMQQVKNAAIITFGAFDRGGEFSTAISNFVTDAASGFGDLGDEAEQLGIRIRSEFAGLSNAFQPLLDGALNAFGQIDLKAIGSRQYIQSLFDTIDTIANFARDRFNDAAQGARDGVVIAAGRIIPGGSVIADRLLPAATPVRGNSQTGPRFREGEEETRRRLSNRAEDRRIDAFFERGGRVPKPGQLRDYIDGTGSFGRPTPYKAPASETTKKGPKGPSAETLARRAEAERQRELRDDEAFANEKAALNQDLLRARQSIATAAETVAQYEIQEIDAARTRQNASYQAEVAQSKLTQARANELIALNDQVASAQREAVNAREAERKRAEAVVIAEADLASARDLANAQAQLADTAADRRAASLRLLDLEYQMERARLDAVLASQQSTEAEREIARRRLALLPQLQAADTANVERQNEGSIARFRRSLNDPATDIEDAVAQKLQDVDDAIADAAARTLGIKDPFLRRLLQIFLEQNVLKPLYDAAQGGGGGAGGFLGSIIKAVPALFGRASGGYVAPGQTVRVNEQRGSGVELLRMGGKGGTVIPLGQASATRSSSQTIIQQTVRVDARGAVMNDQFASLILARANQDAQALVVGNNAATRKAFPAAQARFNSLGTTG